MARPEYTIDYPDFVHANTYVGNRLRDFSLKITDPDTIEQAKEEFLSISLSRPSNDAASRLNEWCKTYLTGDEWKRLKESVRKRRQRWAGSQVLKTVTISEKAHRLLSELAKRDNVTLSEALELYLVKVLNRPPLSTGRRSRTK